MGSSSLAQLCPKLRHLALMHCEIGRAATSSMGCPDLQRLTLHGSSLIGTPIGAVAFLSPQLKSVDVSATQIADNGLRQIVGPPSAALNWVVRSMQCEAPI